MENLEDSFNLAARASFRIRFVLFHGHSSPKINFQLSLVWQAFFRGLYDSARPNHWKQLYLQLVENLRIAMKTCLRRQYIDAIRSMHAK